MSHEKVAEAQAMVGDIAAGGATARILGGIAVRLRCPDATAMAPLARSYSDLDLATNRRSANTVAGALIQHGYEPDRVFNAAHGRTRQLFRGDGNAHIDVFINTFAMCHMLDLEARLDIDRETVPLADLLLTKLQIAQLNEKDVTDVLALLLEHDLTQDDAGLNVNYIVNLLSGDWGWWRTVTANLAAMPKHLPTIGLDRTSKTRVMAQHERLSRAIAESRKSARWRMRARIGDRVPWRDEPEEVNELNSHN
jgi:hypothetical protein